MSNRRHLVAASLAASVLFGAGCETTSAPARDMPPASTTVASTESLIPLARADARFEALAFLSGNWRGAGLGGVCEESVFPPAAGGMAGMFRYHPERGPGFTEFYVFEPGPDGEGIQFLLHHFSPGLRRWEDVPVTFDLVESGPGLARFAERDDADEASELVYRRTGDTLVVELSELREGTRAVVARFDYRRLD